MIRKWFSKFLIALANTVERPREPIAEEFVPSELKSVTRQSVGSVTLHEDDIPRPVYAPPADAPPRVPAVPPMELAGYWRGALDYFSFKTLKKTTAPIETIPISDVRLRGASADGDGLAQSGANVHLVLTLQDSRSRNKGKHYLLSIPAIRSNEGYFAPRTEAPPVLNGAYLGPDIASSAFPIADEDIANAAMTKALCAMVTDATMTPEWFGWWEAAMSALRELMAAADDRSLLERMIERLPRERAGAHPAWELVAIVLAADGGGTTQIGAAYASVMQAMRKGPGQAPLFERLGGQERTTDIHGMPVNQRRTIVGHIDEYDNGHRTLFPLDETQRRAVTAILSLSDGEMQAVNGPPGSGKTSMLRAVVASQWVDAALCQGPCPITLACGATNQSVTNVIEAFGNAPHPDASLPHAQRWIADAGSYGAYVPAKSLLNDKKELERFICLEDRRSGQSNFLYGYWERPDVLDPMRALDYEEPYLAHARATFDDVSLTTLEAALGRVWRALDSIVQAMRRFEGMWSRNPDWREFAWKRLDEQRHVWSASRIEQVNSRIAALSGAPSDEHAQALADLLWRADAFHWAARYWEGRFLLAQRERLLTRHPLNVEEALRRVCMLTPCIVSTLHTAPRLLAIDNRLVDPADPVGHVLGKIDLLIVDEAGQASPELGAAAFALARRAAVIGDMKQLAPIWNHSALTELGVAAQSDTTPRLEAIVRSRRSVASGSTLGMARLLSRWREADDIGVTLRFHYRCKPDIIAYCNTLAYGGKLIARTSEDDKGPEPTMAWVAVNQAPMPTRGSWSNPAEADEIVSWIVERWPTWQSSETTRGRPLHQIVALITPYRPQAELLAEKLKVAFAHQRERQAGEWPDKDDVGKVVIGTVHRLQGAERPIVCFSLVEGPEQGGSSFVDTDASLLNVAVSRAKRSFIIFANPQRLFVSSTGDSVGTQSPSHQLGTHLRHRIHARPLYPQQAVFIEAINKQKTLSAILGKQAGVVATSGALTQLPIGHGVDIMAGFVPRAVNEAGANAFVERATALLADVEEVVLATDDDRMGEYIAWQIKRLLGEKLDGKRIVRARLGAMTRSAVLYAVGRAGDLDERMVMAEIVREIADNLIAGHYAGATFPPALRHARDALCAGLASVGAMESIATSDRNIPRLGRVQAAVLGLLLRQARRSLRDADTRRIIVEIPWRGSTFRGDLVDIATGQDTWSPDTLPDCGVAMVPAPDLPPEIEDDRANAPDAGTISLLGQAWRRHGLTPWATMTALQSLYDGSWAKVDYRNPGIDAYEPTEPIIPIERDGHPPVTPLDRMAPPEVMEGGFVDQDYERVYGLVWERFEATIRGPYRVRFATLDLPLRAPFASSLRIRLRASSCAPCDRERSTTDDEVARLMLGDDHGQANDIDDLLSAWDEDAFDKAVPRPGVMPGGRWHMPLDRLLRDLENAGIGRPSTLARSLKQLVNKGLMVLPVNGGSVTITRAGVSAVLALEELSPELASPDFSAWLAQRLQAIERGNSGPRDVLQWLARFFMPPRDARELAPRIWNSLEDLATAIGRHASPARSGGLVSPLHDIADAPDEEPGI